MPTKKKTQAVKLTRKVVPVESATYSVTEGRYKGCTIKVTFKNGKADRVQMPGHGVDLNALRLDALYDALSQARGESGEA